MFVVYCIHIQTYGQVRGSAWNALAFHKCKHWLYVVGSPYQLRTHIIETMSPRR